MLDQNFPPDVPSTLSRKGKMPSVLSDESYRERGGRLLRMWRRNLPQNQQEACLPKKSKPTVWEGQEQTQWSEGEIARWCHVVHTAVVNQCRQQAAHQNSELAQLQKQSQRSA